MQSPFELVRNDSKEMLIVRDMIFAVFTCTFFTSHDDQNRRDPTVILAFLYQCSFSE